MKYYEFVVGLNGWMYGAYKKKAQAKEIADYLREKHPDGVVTCNVHVYGLPLDDYNCPDSYLYSYTEEL